MRKELFFCDGYGELQTGISRRNLIGKMATLSAGLLASTGVESQSKRESGNTLIVLFLRGGADGLNIIAPYAEDDYYKNRPTLAIAKPKNRRVSQKERLLDLDGIFGLHPALEPIFPYFAVGNAAFIQAVGSGDETRSHFEAMGTMERGGFGSSAGTGDGWLSRVLRSKTHSGMPLHAVSVSSTLPDSLSGYSGATYFSSLSDFSLRVPISDQSMIIGKLKRMYSGHDEMSLAGANSLQVLESIQKLHLNESLAIQSSFPDTALGKAFQQASLLINHELGCEYICLESLGWDTHVAQGGTVGWHAQLLTDVGASIHAFMKSIGPRASRVTLVVQTEFGRRVEENSGFGTDHGHGSVMMVFGGGVRGGKVYGKWPGLSADKLTGPGDLQVTTDYRTILAEILEANHKISDFSKVFPALQESSLGLFS